MDTVLLGLSVFGVIFLGELPDKSAVASLVLGSRYRPLPVLAGVWAAFTVHVVVAVTLGGFVAGLPRRPVEAVTGLLFLAAAVLLLRSDPGEAQREGERRASGVAQGLPAWKVAGGSFGLVLLGEFGDVTQILTATLTARYGEPVVVGAAALLALMTVSALAVTFGRTLLRVVPLRRVQQVAAAVLVVLSLLSLASAAGLQP